MTLRERVAVSPTARSARDCRRCFWRGVLPGGARRASEAGNAGIVTAAAVAFALVVFMVALNLVVDEYGAGALRTVLDEASRAGSLQGAPGGPVAACQDKASQVMGGLLAGPFARDVRITCALDAGTVTASADGSFPAWLGVIPADRIRLASSAVVAANP